MANAYIAFSEIKMISLTDTKVPVALPNLLQMISLAPIILIGIVMIGPVGSLLIYDLNGIFVLIINRAASYYLRCPPIWTYCLVMLIGAITVTILYLVPLLNKLFPHLFKVVVTSFLIIGQVWGMKISSALDKECLAIYQDKFPSLYQFFLLTFGCTVGCTISLLSRIFFKPIKYQSLEEKADLKQ